MGSRVVDAPNLALRGLSALQLWRQLALAEARFLRERDERWQRGDFTQDALPGLSASVVLARGMHRLPADYSLHLSAKQAEHIAQKLSIDLPLEVQIISRDERRLTTTAASRLLAVPDSPQFCILAPGIFVASPELALVDAAAKLDDIALLLAACELCGLYSSDSQRGELLERPQVARRSRLAELAPELAGSKGVTRARFAAAYAFERSRSPRETQLALLLSLPFSRGGYKLLRPLLNHDIELKGDAAKMLGRSSCECDLFFPQASLAVFYDSEDTHLNSRQQYNDARRHNALALAGVTELTVTNSQIKDITQMDMLAEAIAKAHGKPHATTRRDFRSRQLKLWRELGLR